MSTRAASAPRKRDAINETLREVFGLQRLRPGQHQVIANVMARRSTLAVMPTGAGKSLCYQLPALLLPGRTVVVSPLIALMKDQVDKLVATGVTAVAVNSTLNSAEADAALSAIECDATSFMFATPERLAEPEFLALLRLHPIDLLVIDEAHCISQWGHDFRPAFLEIGSALSAPGRPQVLALTATANQRVIDDIAAQLGIEFDVIGTGVYRHNLRFSVRQVTRDDERIEAVVRWVAAREDAGIVYTATVKAAKLLHERLQAAGASVALYHGRLSAGDRRINQDAFMNGQGRVMVATNAFGLGIDKRDIRYVLHFQMPANLDAYYHEAGRAGRDGEPASCALLYLHQDRALRRFLQSGRYPTADDVAAVLAALRAAREAGLAPTVRELTATLQLPATKIQVALQLLKEHRVARQSRQWQWRLAVDTVGDAAVREWASGYQQRADDDREALERMVFYAQTGFCRWKVLLEHFGEAEDFERCGQCDNCIQPPARAVGGRRRRRALAVTAPPRFKPGDTVRVERFGTGRVLAASSETLTLESPDGSTRDFVPDFVQAA